MFKTNAEKYNKTILSFYNYKNVIKFVYPEWKLFKEKKMTLLELIKKTPDHILLDATNSLCRCDLEHYHGLKPENVRARLANLYYTVKECLVENKEQPIINFMHKVGEERFEAGFYLHEVQTAINILEESIWRQIVMNITPDQQAEALERIQGIMCIAKRELARTYIAHEKKVFAVS